MIFKECDRSEFIFVAFFGHRINISCNLKDSLGHLGSLHLHLIPVLRSVSSSHRLHLRLDLVSSFCTSWTLSHNKVEFLRQQGMHIWVLVRDKIHWKTSCGSWEDLLTCTWCRKIRLYISIFDLFFLFCWKNLLVISYLFYRSWDDQNPFDFPSHCSFFLSLLLLLPWEHQKDCWWAICKQRHMPDPV